MSVPENNLRDDNGNPPSLSIEVKKLKDLPRTSKQWSDVRLPVDILLLTVENCEFLACHYYLRDAFKSYSQSLGSVYFGNMGDQDKPWKVALVKSSKGSSDPGGSQTTVTNAVTLLRPKITFCVGFCKGLNHENTNLGDVVVSCKLTTEAYKTPVSRNVGNLVRNVADGWHPPLDCPETFREVKVHCDGEILSCPGPVSDEQHTKMHPEAIAVEMEGKGVFTAAYDLKSEWVVVKGVSCFADSSANKSWEAFASVMAASVVANLLSDPYVFEQWPHHGGMSAGEDSSSSNSKRESPCSSGQPDAERTKLAAQPTEQDMKGINREQELDQYEDHNTWLEMVKQDWHSFKRLLNEEQTHQQRKRLNLFVARFQDQLPDVHKCDGCSLKLSGIRYRCLNCVDVDFCCDCYMKRVKVKGHSENHEVIEMRFKCADCKGFIPGTRFCCYECPEFFLCSECQSRHPATHKVTKFPVNKEPFAEKFQKQLHSHYNTFNKVKIIPWERASAIHIDEIHTQLSWARDDRKASGVTQKELEDYTDIFKGDEHHPNPKRLLVYGRPGVGKSTFSQKTAFDWSNQRKRSLMKFDVVLLIKLRDVCDLKDIRDVLRASKLLAGDEVDSADDVYEYILRNQEKVLLILDGYDEYFCTCDQSPVRDIWEGKLLRDMHVIITTRHEKTDELRLPSHVQYEINGFKSDDQVRAFASRFLRDQDVKEFLSYLKENNLRGIAEIPLLLSMLCLVWKENHQRELLKSRADIYTKCLQTLLHHAIEKDAKPKQFRKINDYKEQLCELGKFALDALSEDKLAFPLNKLPDGFLATELIEVGLFHVLNVSSVDPEKDVYFLHKSVQEFLAAFYLKEELLKETSTACLSQVDSMKKIIKMTEVLRFACELSADVAFTVLSHLGIVGKKEGLTEYNFTGTLCIRDLSDEQQLFLTLISHAFFCCASEKRRDLYPVFLSYAGGVLLIDSDQLHSIANTHMLKSAAAPELILFSNEKHTEQSYQDLISVLEDISAVIVSCSGEKKASEFLKKYSLHKVNDIFLKKEEGKIYLYISRIDKRFSPIPTAMLRELLSSPEFTQSKKPVDNQANEQDDSIALCLTENSTFDTQATQHCLSCVSIIDADVKERQEMETLIDVLAFVRFPRFIVIIGNRSATDPVLVDKVVSHINFTNRLEGLALCSMNLTAKPASVIARSLYQAPNMRVLNLSWNPLGEGVSDLARHLCCNPDLQTLHLFHVKMTKKQVNDLSEAVHQSKIRDFWSSYHDKEGNPKPEHDWPAEDYWMDLSWRERRARRARAWVIGLSKIMSAPAATSKQETGSKTEQKKKREAETVT